MQTKMNNGGISSLFENEKKYINRMDVYFKCSGNLAQHQKPKYKWYALDPTMKMGKMAPHEFTTNA